MSDTWKIAILKAIESLHGEADLQQVYERISQFITLTDKHEAIAFERPMYQHTIRTTTSELRRLGELTRVERGRYRLTEKGRRRIAR